METTLRVFDLQRIYFRSSRTKFLTETSREQWAASHFAARIKEFPAIFDSHHSNFSARMQLVHVIRFCFRLDDGEQARRPQLKGFALFELVVVDVVYPLEALRRM